jgi:hypothetical protein
MAVIGFHRVHLRFEYVGCRRINLIWVNDARSSRDRVRHVRYADLTYKCLSLASIFDAPGYRSSVPNL